jgi:hypothetical protein
VIAWLGSASDDSDLAMSKIGALKRYYRRKYKEFRDVLEVSDSVDLEDTDFFETPIHKDFGFGLPTLGSFGEVVRPAMVATGMGHAGSYHQK